MHQAPRVAVPSMQLLNKTLVGRSRALALAACGYFILCLAWQLPDKWFASFQSIPAVREITLLLTVLCCCFCCARFLTKAWKWRKSNCILLNREANLLGLMYLMGMGSLLGFAVLPAFIKAVFGLQQVGGVWQANPVAPAVLVYGWLPVVLGLVARAAGSWLAQRLRASLINQKLRYSFCLSALFLWLITARRHKKFAPRAIVFEFLSGPWCFVAAGISAGSVMNMALKACRACLSRHWCGLLPWQRWVRITFPHVRR